MFVTSPIDVSAKAQRVGVCRTAFLTPRRCLVPAAKHSLCLTSRAAPSASLLRLSAGPPASHRTHRVMCAASEDVVEMEMKIEGMVCGGCSSRVVEALKAADHVKSVDVSLETKLARVDVEAANQIDALKVMEKLIDTVNAMGFTAEPHFG